MIRVAGVNIKNEPTNLMELRNQSGVQSQPYERILNQLLSVGAGEVRNGGKTTARETYEGVCSIYAKKSPTVRFRFFV